MKLKVSTVFEPSKKKKQFLTVEVVEGDTPNVGDILEINSPVKSAVEIEADEDYERTTKRYES